MAQVELQCGPYRIVSLMSREAADELGLEPGVLAVAAVKSTNVVVEVPEHGGEGDAGRIVDAPRVAAARLASPSRRRLCCSGCGGGSTRGRGGLAGVRRAPSCPAASPCSRPRR